jgi:hypothetical protein
MARMASCLGKLSEGLGLITLLGMDRNQREREPQERTMDRKTR